MLFLLSLSPPQRQASARVREWGLPWVGERGNFDDEPEEKKRGQSGFVVVGRPHFFF